jgi:cytoskeleton protein RodZ
MSIDLSKIGVSLKETRTEKGLTVIQVSEALFLKKSVIEAIEAGDWNSLPHTVYVKGYVKEYAAFLGLDVSTYEPAEPAGAVLAGQNEVSIPNAPFGWVSRALAYRIRLPKAAILAPMAIIVVIAFMLLLTYDQRKPAGISGDEHGDKTPTTSYTNSVDKKVYPDLTEGKKLMVTCHERTWISVIIDGAEKKEFMLSPQEVVVLNARDRFDLLIGNAGGVKLYLDGKGMEFSGRSGEVKRIRIS